MNNGLVLFGINNIFTVQSGDETIECRLKGKVLKDTGVEHNPLAPGDRVAFQVDTHDRHYGMITERLERKNAFTRWNRKKNRIQTIAANVDSLVCVTSAGNPPFRPRFIDRVILEAERSEIPVILAANKCDLPMSRDMIIRLEDFRRMGYQVIRCSAVTGEGMQELAEGLTEKTVVFFGQSGVGKSTLLNRLYPGLGRKTGAVSIKNDRGIHTTVYSVLLPLKEGAVIDTPGIRELELRGLDFSELAYLFRDIRGFTDSCGLRNCRHLDEPDCAVREAARSGAIHPDRYESYRMILLALEDVRLNEYR